LRVGVTGHRTLSNELAILSAVREALTRLKSLVPTSTTTPVALVVVSALAEGADRLVAREALSENGACLEVVLPMPEADYLTDFQSEASRDEFRHLLRRASETSNPPPGFKTREEAYEWAGRQVVDRSDAVIGLWDGEPSRGRGGTAEVLAYAEDRGVPLVWVKTQGAPSITEKLGVERARVISEAARQLSEFNRRPLFERRFRRRFRERMVSQRTLWRLDAVSADDGEFHRLPRERVADWLLPYFIRADLQALWFQFLFKVLGSAVFVIAALAVAIVTIQTNVFPQHTWLVAIEVALLCGLLAIPTLSRWLRLHNRWISYRYLAERLRSLYFLTLAGTGDRQKRSAKLAYLSDPAESWIERALSEVRAHRPPVQVGRGGLDQLRTYLARYWIEDQARYHAKTQERDRTWDVRISRLTQFLFTITVVAALLHMVHFAHDSALATLVVVVSICVPAFGAAAHGIATQRQYRRHSERYGRMSGLLQQRVAEILIADSLQSVQSLAAETERLIREENSDWFGVMRFHDIELIT